MKKTPEYLYLIFDARYTSDDDETSDRAICFETSRTLKEAQKNRKDYWDDCVIVRSEIEWEYLVNEVLMPNK